jgi:hypothetical protein
LRYESRVGVELPASEADVGEGVLDAFWLAVNGAVAGVADLDNGGGKVFEDSHS